MQRYFAKEKIGENFVLYESDIHHIKNVMRYNISDTIEVVYENIVNVCSIESLSPLLLKVISSTKEDKDLNINLTIAISLVNEQKMDLILQKLTELGVSRIIPIKTERSIVKIDEKRHDKKIDRWQMIVKEASEQSKRTNVPQVERIITIDELKKISCDNKFICSLTENTKSLDYYMNNHRLNDILFFIGPEGGFSEKEEKNLIESNFLPVSLGKRVLRVETAAIYVASIMNYFYGD